VVARAGDLRSPRPTGDLDLVRLGGRMSATPLRLDRAGPGLGEHTNEVLSDLLGLSADEIAALAEEGVLT
jgi:crotonobetainyl-CoA:carnitine CoA-transferase CaiB-like acyl-CoA transferase